MRAGANSQFVSILLLGLTLLGLGSVATRPSLVVSETRLEQLPLHIGSLAGTEMNFEDSVYAHQSMKRSLFTSGTTGPLEEGGPRTSPSIVTPDRVGRSRNGILCLSNRCLPVNNGSIG